MPPQRKRDAHAGRSFIAAGVSYGRKLRGWSQQELERRLAEESGDGHDWTGRVTNIETMRKHKFDADELELLSRVLGLPVNFLVRGLDELTARYRLRRADQRFSAAA